MGCLAKKEKKIKEKEKEKKDIDGSCVFSLLW